MFWSSCSSSLLSSDEVCGSILVLVRAVATVIYFKIDIGLISHHVCLVPAIKVHKLSSVAVIRKWFPPHCSVITRLKPYKISSKYTVVCCSYVSGSAPCNNFQYISVDFYCTWYHKWGCPIMHETTLLVILRLMAK